MFQVHKLLFACTTTDMKNAPWNSQKVHKYSKYCYYRLKVLIMINFYNFFQLKPSYDTKRDACLTLWSIVPLSGRLARVELRLRFAYSAPALAA